MHCWFNEMDCLPRLDSAKLYDMSHQHVNKLLCVTESFCLVVLGRRLRLLQNWPKQTHTAHAQHLILWAENAQQSSFLNHRSNPALLCLAPPTHKRSRCLQLPSRERAEMESAWSYTRRGCWLPVDVCRLCGFLLPLGPVLLVSFS